MYETSYNGVRYCFYDDHLTIDDTALRYDLLMNVEHRSGDNPAYLFDYKGRRFEMPYSPEEFSQISPYMDIASRSLSGADPVDSIPLNQIASSPVVQADPVIGDPDLGAASSDAEDKKNMKVGCIVFIVIVVILLIALFACFGGSDDDDADDAGVASDAPVVTEEAAETPTAEPNPVDDLSAEERNAYYKALDYLDYDGFSRSSLIEQLKFEGYSEEASEKAVSLIEENGEVDWESECLEKARSYLDYDSFSRDGLIDQLKFEGFTDDQINAIIDEAYQ